MRRSALALVVLLCLPAAAIPPLTLADLTARSTRVVHGEVTAVVPRWEGQMIVSDVTVQVAEYLKGSGSDPVVFEIPGGQIGDVRLDVSEAPEFKVGQEVVVFLRTGTSRCDVYGWHRGKYTIKDGGVEELKGMSITRFRKSILDLVKDD